jgi:hypothetical protein
MNSSTLIILLTRAAPGSSLPVLLNKMAKDKLDCYIENSVHASSKTEQLTGFA